MKQKGLWAAIALGVLVFAGIMWPRGGTAPASSNVQDRAAAESVMASYNTGAYTYELTGTAPVVDITEHQGDGSVQRTDEPLPYTSSTTGSFRYISAQITGGNDGDVTCTIKDPAGNVVAKNTSTGSSSIVTCRA